jgi:hypothetical protein
MAKHWLTGEDDGTDGETKSILSNDGVLKPILGDPASRAALLQIGLNWMQPSWNSTSGQIGEAIGHGGEVGARLDEQARKERAQDLEERKLDDDMTKSDALLKIRNKEADAYTVAQGAKSTYDRLELQRLKDEAASGRQGVKNYHDAATKTFTAVQEAANSVMYDPANPNPLVERYRNKSIPEIERMMREEDKAAGGIVEPPRGSAVGRPTTIRQNGHTYTLQPDGSYK